MMDCGCNEPGGGFVALGGRWMYVGTLTFADATAVFDASRKLPLPATGVVDLTGLEHADSSALSVMLAVKRRAVSEGLRLEFAAIPPGLHALAHVYGVEELLAS
jgi:phospholipid transport system transporter-binding protein